MLAHADPSNTDPANNTARTKVIIFVCQEKR